MKHFNAFIRGILLPFRALSLIMKHHTLFLWSLLPLTLSILTYYIIWEMLLAPLKSDISSHLANYISGVLGGETIGHMQLWLQTIISWIVGVLMWFGLAISFSTITNILALPFNDLLARHCEQFTSPPIFKEQPFNLRHEIQILFIDLKKGLLSAALLLLCFSVAWVPIMNIFATVLSWLLITFQYVTYPQTRRGIGARLGFKSVCTNFFQSIGFGATIAIGCGLPLLFLFIPPIAIVSGTIFFAEEINTGEKEPI